jgi:hypothetical protein
MEGSYAVILTEKEFIVVDNIKVFFAKLQQRQIIRFELKLQEFGCTFVQKKG